MLIIAHRGASVAAPENTLEAFEKARELGADWVELDVRRTADEVLVVHHDAHLEDSRDIFRLEAAKLPKSIPTLDEALAACGGDSVVDGDSDARGGPGVGARGAPIRRVGVNIEIKNGVDDPDYDDTVSMVPGVIDAARRFGAPDGVLVTSFDPAVIARVRELDAELATGLLVFGGDAGAVIERTVAGGHGAVNPHDHQVDADFMERASAAGLAVYPWTVDDPKRITELRDLGVAGVITNVPDLARAAVEVGDRP